MPDARFDELSGLGIYHDVKPRQVYDATDYSLWKLKPRCKTRDSGGSRIPLLESLRAELVRRALPAWVNSPLPGFNGDSWKLSQYGCTALY
jgi:hypothetical protein